MSFRASPVVLVALAALAAFAGDARAQAPGETAVAEGETVMARRWAGELAIGGAGLKPKGDTDSTGFGMLGVAGRFRLRPAIEFAAGITFGGAKVDTFQLSTSALYLEFRYRFLAEQPWNVFALGGLGVASVAQRGAGTDERKGRGMLRLGGGVERRFGGGFAVDATLRILAIAENNPDAVTEILDPPFTFAHFGVSGLAFAVAGTYYF